MLEPIDIGVGTDRLTLMLEPIDTGAGTYRH
jgi:hypothetical protein